MRLEEAIQKTDNYLEKDEGHPLIVDVCNPEDIAALTTHYEVDVNSEILHARKFCKKDELPRFDDMFEELTTAQNNIFLTGISPFLLLSGGEEVRQTLRQILTMNVQGHVVLITYGCRQYLPVDDPRLQRRLIFIDGDELRMPNVVFIAPSLPVPSGISAIKGIEKLADAIEKPLDNSADTLYFVTQKTKAMFSNAMLNIREIKSAYDALSRRNGNFNIGEDCGTEEQWEYALSLFGDGGSWEDVIDARFGDHRTLEHVFANFKNFENDDKWLYYIGLKLFGAKHDSCLQSAAAKAVGLDGFIERIFLSLLDKNVGDGDFWEFYKLRKAATSQLSDYDNELQNYCRLLDAKGKNALCYLTDNTELEKKTVFKYLDRYGEDIDRSRLIDILEKVYPDLYNYLLPYSFESELLTEYFDEYKYQKVINKVFPEFLEKVEEQAITRKYNLLLQPRSFVLDRLNLENSQLYFMDAMGVEYLSYIVALCKELKMAVNIKVCQGELPSITECNKDFLEYFENAAAPTVSVKEIDDIKHHGKYDYDFYNNSKLPTYLIKELEVIREILVRIKSRLLDGEIKRIFMIADHGASRLSVLYDTENRWEMSEKGLHSGRCCPKSDFDVVPDFATDAGDFWALANYDRFKGGRKANVEVHGGATLEEVCVPIVELKLLDRSLRVFLMASDSDNIDYENTVEIKISFRKKAALKVLATDSISDARLVVDGKYYKASSVDNDNRIYKFDLPDIRKAGTYYADVLSGDTVIAEKIPFIVKREGVEKRDIL